MHSSAAAMTGSCRFQQPGAVGGNTGLLPAGTAMWLHAALQPHLEQAWEKLPSPLPQAQPALPLQRRQCCPWMDAGSQTQGVA